jgi:hypothetical protein
VDVGGYPTPGVTFDRAYIDVTAFGLNWRLGRQAYTLGPIGLLFASGSLNIFAGDNVGVDGLKVTGSFGPLAFEASGFSLGTFPVGSLNTAYSALMARASMQLMPGWTVGVNFLRENCNQNCIPPNVSTGWGVSLAGMIVPGITLTAEYANFTPDTAVFGTFPDNTAYQINTVFNLGQLTGMTALSPSLRIQYKHYGTTFSPLYRGGSDLLGVGTNPSFTAGSYTSNYQAWNAQLSLTFSPFFRPYVNYESGSYISTGTAITELELGFYSQITTGVTARFRYQKRDDIALGPNPRTNRYRLQIDASW